MLNEEDCTNIISCIGRSLMITPRSKAQEGFMDVNQEDYADPKDGYFIKKQTTQLRIIEDKWLDDYKVRIYKEWSDVWWDADFEQRQGQRK